MDEDDDSGDQHKKNDKYKSIIESLTKFENNNMNYHHY